MTSCKNLSICGSDCCEKCPIHGKTCPGCRETGGHPCGGTCVAAERIESQGMESYLALKAEIVARVNSLGLPGLEISDLFLLNGSYVNLAYPMPDGQNVKLLCDSRVYFGNQVEQQGSDRCYGLVADETMLVVCEYGCGGSDPELLVYRKY